MKHEGRKRSDIPAKAGRSPWKNYIDERVYFDLFYPDKIVGKTRNVICEKTRKEALKQEQARAAVKNEKPKNILAVKTIKNRLKTELDKLFS